MPDSLYDHPLYYDILFGWDRGAEAAFYERVFLEYGSPPGGQLLEVACGTGQIALRLAARRWRVTGLDRRPAMLAFLLECARARNLAVATLCADMTTFASAVQFDAAFCPMGSFHLLPDDQSAIAHLRSVAAALAAHGRYVLDLTFTAADNAIAIEPWSMARGTITVSATAAGIVVDNSATRDHCTLDWGGDLRPYSVASFDRLLQTAEVFAPEATYPEHRTTAEGVTVFDLEHCTAASEGRTIVVLKLA